MKRIQKKCCVFLMVFLLTISMMPRQIIYALDSDITQNNYEKNEDGIFEFIISKDNISEIGAVVNVDVPKDYIFVIDDCSFSITGNMTLKGNLSIFGDNGKFVGSIQAEQGAEIMFGSGANVPNDMELYDANKESFNKDNINWNTFVYTDGKWIEKNIGDMDPNHFITRIDGLVVDNENGKHYTDYRVQYSYDYGVAGPTWYNPYVEDNTNDGYIVNRDSEDLEFVLDNIPGNEENPWDGKVTIKIDIRDKAIVEGYSTKIIAFAELLGFDEGSSKDLFSYVDSNGKTLIYTINVNDSLPHFFHLELAYPNQGDGAIVDEVNNYLYAYSGNTDAEIEKRLATELYERFIKVPMFERFGFSYEDNSQNDANNINELQRRIDDNPTNGEAITVKLANGTTSTRNVKVFTVNWGYDMLQGRPVKSEIPVIVLDNTKEFIVCTDFNSDTGVGTKYYAQTVGANGVHFSDELDDDGYVILTNDYRNVVAGGNGASTDVLNTDGLYTFKLSNGMFKTNESDEVYNIKVRIINSDNTYVALHGEGENKKVGGLGLNSVETDTVWETGGDAKAQVFIGDKTVYLQPLNNNLGIHNTEIVSVKLKDASQRDGVTIDVSNLSKIKLEFKSNFYDSVTLSITYSGGITKELTVQRIGLVINYWYLFDPESNETSEQRISYDFKNEECSFKYNYNKGEQILVYATYYHATNDSTVSGGNDLYLNIKYDDGHSEIIHHTDSAHGFNGYTGGTNDAVATTSFIIGFAPAKEFDGQEWVGEIREQTFKNKYGNNGGLSATVINAGYNDDTSYGGTQIGSGSGVYWDGNISWY